MALYRNGSFADDPWRRLESADDLIDSKDLERDLSEKPVSTFSHPALTQGHALLSLTEWRRIAPVLTNSNVAFGVILEPGETAEAIAEDLPRLALVAVSFPKFTDGRGYSTARILRDRYKFAGELRATGDILFDQLQLYARCGFDTLEITDPVTISLVEAGRKPAMTHFYQPGERPEVKDSTNPWRRRSATSA